MDLSQFIDSCLLHPEMVKMSRKQIDGQGKLVYTDIPEDRKRAAIEGEVPLVLSKCCSAYPFPWLVRTATFTGGTVSGTSDYKLDGANQDCAQVLSVLYDSDETLLEYTEQSDIDILLTRIGTPTDVVAWYVKGERENFPLITLITTPASSGKQIKYRYWVTPEQFPFEKWPDKWLFVIKSQLIARFSPGLEAIARDDFAGMLNTHNKGGTRTRTIIQDSTVMANNLRRNSLFGYGGGR